MNLFDDPLAICVILFALGCALVVFEVFVPSGGILGFLAGVLIIGSIIMAFYYRGTTTGATFLIVAVVAVPTLIGLAFKYWPQTPMGKAFLGELPDEAELAPHDIRRELVGKVGVARTKMLPSGSIEVEGNMYDAVSRGVAIEPGQRIVVSEVKGNRVVVRPAAEKEDQPPRPDPDDVLSRSIDELGIESLDDPLS
jgi:membrane-bound serine protease (ClpP class)